MRRACQRCGDLADRCICPRFAGQRHMVCEQCGALWGNHLLDFARGEERSVCRPPAGEPTFVDQLAREDGAA